MASKGSSKQWLEELAAAKARIAEPEAQLANQQRATAEAALRESEPRYRPLMQSIPIPLGVLNTHGEVIYFNDRVTQVFGYTQKDIPTLEAW